ncbi:MAG: hypothetical protein JO037_19010 [Actinobacteria bacterium]|nr:hypothetical protein [Actinomycetota bacterium]
MGQEQSPPAAADQGPPGPAGAAPALAGVLGEMACIVDGLAADLARIGSALTEAAYTASRYGVNIGADGRPPPVPCGPPASAAAASERHWALSYRRAWERAAADAQHAGQRAVSQLTDLCARTEAPAANSSGG